MTKFYFYRWFSGVLQKKTKTGSQSVPSRRALSFESLENREMLSVAPLLYLTPSPEPDYLQSNWFEQLEIKSDSFVENEGIIENEWIIQLNQESLKNLYSVSKAAEYLDDYGVTVICGLGTPGILQVRIDTDSVSLQEEILAGIDGIEYWQQNYVYAASGIADYVNDPATSSQWYLDTLNVLPAWKQTNGEGVIVGILEPSFNNLFIHPDLQSQIWTNPNEKSNGFDDDGNGLIDDIHGWDFNRNEPDVSGSDPNNTKYDHGAMVASVIAAVSNNQYGGVGIAPNVQILPVQVGDGEIYTLSAEIAGINYLIQLKTKYKVNICAINMSLYGFPERALTQSLIAAGEAGIMVIHAAGNESKNMDTLSGTIYADDKNSDLENHIIVAATTTNDTLATFSSYGQSTVHLGAPGLSIYYKSYRQSDTGTLISYDTFIAGTSFSAPIVTGAVALIASLHPNWTPTQIKDAILSSVDPIPSLEGKVATGGRLNIGDAINWSFDPVAQKPNTPSDLSVLLLTNDSFQLKWKDNSKNETSFEVQYLLNNGAWTTINNLNLGRNKTTVTFPISPSGTYQFRIKAVNDNDSSDWSDIVSVTKDTSNPPPAPGQMTVSINTDYLSLWWDSVTGADHYRLERTLYGENDWTEVYFGTDCYFDDYDLVPNRIYEYRVFTISGNIASVASPVKLQTSASKSPDIPTGITVTMLESNSVQFIWGDVKYARSYYIERYDTKKKDWVEIARTTVASFTDTKLQPTTNYLYRIRAENDLKSEYSEEINIATLGSAPKAPTSVKGVAQGNSVALTWKAANGATAYHVEYSLDGKTNWETALLSSQTLTGGTVTGLEFCTKYYFRVYSISNSGESEKPSS
ncbi:MAG: S8 family serine peptidase, partial [Planctomycetaceae bacterium]|nr:S8 family serine peptidase [Planctomycetaceae bacterium]